jgi:hypothetical protein
VGLLEKIFPKNKPDRVQEYFRTLTVYTPRFTSYAGGLYEMDLTRSAIHTFAKHCAKLKPEIMGKSYRNLEKTLQFKPNQWMDTYKFLYRVATALKVDNTAFIVPLYGADMMTIVGLYPLKPQQAEILTVDGTEFLRYHFSSGQKASIELDRVGILTNHQYGDDVFGSTNAPLDATMQLLDIQNQGMQEAIKQSAVLRFQAKLGQTLRPEDIEKERQQFSAQNLSSDNTSGVLMFDAKYAEVKQIESKPYVVDNLQMDLIQQNVFNYLGVNKAVLQNSYNEDEFNAFYEGEIEPFALQLSLVLTNMLFTPKELAFGNQVIFSANRMQYASNTTKLNVSTQLYDRGLITLNQVMDIWNMAHVENGDTRKIRGEYVDIDADGKKVTEKEVEPNANQDEPEGIPSTGEPDPEGNGQED